MPNDLYYDLSAAVNLQNTYVNDLSSIYNENTDNASDIAVQLSKIQSAISQMSSEYDKANSSSDAVLQQQQEMMKILQVEQQRLLEKKAIFDQVEAENDRKVLLNTTYRKKYTQYTKITIVVVMVLIAIVIIRLMGKYITVFPESLYSFLMIAVISIGIIYIFILYADLSARSSIDYDKIEISPPKLDASGNLIVNSPAGPSIWGMFDTCKGSKCCSVGTSWSDQLSLCVVQPYTQGSGLVGSSATVKPTMSTTTAPATTPAKTTTVPATTPAKTTTVPATTTAKTNTVPATTPAKTTTVPATTTAAATIAPATTTAAATTAPRTTTASGFTTMAQSVAYGDINQSTKILPSSIQTTNAWMGDTSGAKPNAYLEYNQFQKI